MNDESHGTTGGDPPDPDESEAHSTHPSGTIPASPPPSVESGGSESSVAERDVIADRYEILTLLGQGAMGSVYKVYDRELEEVVALKTLQRRFVKDEDALQNFRREVKLARRISHPNVARTYDIGVEDEVDFLTMEYIEGEALDRRLEREAPLGNRDFYEYVEPVAGALVAAHDAGVVHRDLKPENVMVGQEGRVAVTDFGLARSSAHTTLAPPDDSGIVGTPAYMAPEQVQEDREIAEPVDIYALGVMMYQMLTGTLPWTRDDPVAMAVARCNNPPPRLPDDGDWPAAYRRAVHRSLKRDPDERIGDAEELLHLLEKHRSGEFRSYPSNRTGSGSWNRSSTPSSSRDAFSSNLGLESNTGVRTLAVLPFEYSGPEEESYLADGLTEELIDELSRSEDVAVLPMGTVETYRGERVDPRRVGDELGVQLVAEGSLRQFGDTLRARVGVTSVHEGFQLWAESFSVEPSELLEVAQTAADGIAEALTGTEGEETRDFDAPTDPVAVDLYMQGRQSMRDEWYTDLSGAIDRFDRALDRAPGDPRILSGLATAEARASFVDGDRREEHLERARETAERAVDSAPEWPQPYVALGMAHYNAVEFREALEALGEALKRSPDYAEAHDLRGRIFVEVGPLETAMEHLDRALDLNPYFYTTRWDLARAHALLGNWDRTEQLMEEPAETQTHEMMRIADRSRLDIWRDEPAWLDEPIDETVPEGSEFRIMTEVWRHVARTGDLDDTHREMLHGVVEPERSESRYLSMHFQFRAEIGARIEDDRYAMENLERAVGAGLLDINWIEQSPLLEPYTGHPSYERARDTVQERVDAIFGTDR